MREIEIVHANPAGNITVFVCGEWEDWTAEERETSAVKLLADKQLKAEQLGFIKEPRRTNEFWRLDMAGGEFCGNAARAFGFYAAYSEGSRGAGRIIIEMSGAAVPLSVDYDIPDAVSGILNGDISGFASTAIPLPRKRKTISYQGRECPLYIFDGIHHLIIEDTPGGEDCFFALKGLAEKEAGLADAFGVLFYNRAEDILQPVVFVRALNTMTFESSCGSGSAAFACEYFINKSEGEGSVLVRQPGGVIKASVVKNRGEIAGISIGGPVTIQKKRKYHLPA
ncbi:MAG: hypothetical protein LBV68_01355 [Spirochaetaceae bacterium]|jgi:diaminopimelate epimerase|nr:hypothetical protein [Spirochaetaceae bacterium]